MDVSIDEITDETHDWVHSAFDWDSALLAYPEEGTNTPDPSRPIPGPTNRCLFIPEILGLIIDFVDAETRNDENGVQADLVSCSQVSRLWYSIANPVLYARPWFGASGQHYSQFVGRVAPKINTDRGNQLSHFVRDLDLGRLQHHGSKATTARLISRTKDSLRAFTAPYTQFGINCIPAICNVKQLQYLDIRMKGCKREADFSYKETAHIISSLPHLRWLSMPRRMKDDATEFRCVKWPSRLRHLNLNRQSHLRLIEAADGKPTSVTSLRVESQFVGPEAFKNVPNLLPNLESLTIRGYGEAQSNVGAFDHIPVLLPKLKHLRIPTGLITPAIFTKHYAIPPRPASLSDSATPAEDQFYLLHTLELDFYVHPIKSENLNSYSPYYNPVVANGLNPQNQHFQHLHHVQQALQQAQHAHQHAQHLAHQQLQQQMQQQIMQQPQLSLNNLTSVPAQALAAFQHPIPHSLALFHQALSAAGLSQQQIAQLGPGIHAPANLPPNINVPGPPAPNAPPNFNVGSQVQPSDPADAEIEDDSDNDNSMDMSYQISPNGTSAPGAPLTATLPNNPVATNLSNTHHHHHFACHHRRSSSSSSQNHNPSNSLSITPSQIWSATTTGSLVNLRRLRVHRSLNWPNTPEWEPAFRLMCKHLLACQALDRERGEERISSSEAGVRVWGEIFDAGRDFDAEGNEI